VSIISPQYDPVSSFRRGESLGRHDSPERTPGTARPAPRTFRPPHKECRLAHASNFSSFTHAIKDIGIVCRCVKPLHIGIMVGCFSCVLDSPCWCAALRSPGSYFQRRISTLIHSFTAQYRRDSRGPRAASCFSSPSQLHSSCPLSAAHSHRCQTMSPF
jgi:hypothetical protein